MSVVLRADLRPQFPPLSDLADPVKVAAIVNAQEWEVREGLFLADVEFRVGPLVLDRGRVPIIDLGMSLRYSLDNLLLNGEAVLDFQGTSSRINLVLSAGEVEVRANYADGDVACPFTDLYRAVLIYLRDSLDVLSESAPDILKNEFIEHLYRNYGVREKGRKQFIRHSRVMADVHGGV